MKLKEARPDPDDLSLFEVFQQARYSEGPEEEKVRLQMASAKYRYDEEHRASFFQTYFPGFNPEELRGQRVLDLGCFTGGRLVYWTQRYGIAEPVGLDINPVFEEAGTRFATSKGVEARFVTGIAEATPFDADYFDYIVSYDVFEHVQDVRAALQECRRTLRPGGRFLLAFPQYRQPAESHLGFVTKTPALQWLFSGRTLNRAFNTIIEERGPSAQWYAREQSELEPWERSPTLNGISVRRFRSLVRETRWEVEWWPTRPIFAGRASRGGVFAFFASALSLPARMPLLEELLLNRICCILRKPQSG